MASKSGCGSAHTCVHDETSYNSGREQANVQATQKLAQREVELGPNLQNQGTQHNNAKWLQWLQPVSSFSCLPFLLFYLFALRARALQIFKFNLALTSNVPRCRPSAPPFQSWQCRMVRVVTVCTVTACARARYGAHLEPRVSVDSRERRPRVWSPPPRLCPGLHCWSARPQPSQWALGPA